MELGKGREIRLGTEEAADFLRKAIGIFDVGEMRGVELDIPRAGNMSRQETAVGRSGGGIVHSRDHQRWSVDVAELLAKVKIANCSAASDVAFGVD